MAEFLAIPESGFGRGFHVESNRERVAQLLEITRDEFEVQVSDQRYRIDTTSFTGTRFTLVDEQSRTIATAERASAISPRYDISRTGQPMCAIHPVSTFGRKHHVLLAEEVVGLIDPDNLSTRTIVASVPPGIDLPLCVFMIWLVQREAR